MFVFMRKINVGIIGFGLSGRVFHTSLLLASPEYRIVKVFSSREKEIKSILPDATVVNELGDIFNDSEIDLVIICGPNKFHFEQTKLALEAGKHVVVEKPFVVNSKEGEELIKLAEQKELILTVFHNRRWDGDFLNLKKAINNNLLGPIQQFESNFDRWRPSIRQNKWKEMEGEGTGILYDLGSHLIDQCLDLFGIPEEVLADIEEQKNNPGVVDYFHIIFRYKKMRAILHSSSFSKTSPRFRVLGEKGNFIKSELDNQEELMSMGTSPLDNNFGKENIEDYQIYYEDENDSQFQLENGQYLSFYTNMAQAIIDREKAFLPVEPRDAVNVIKLIELCVLSNKKKSWIKVEKF